MAQHTPTYRERSTSRCSHHYRWGLFLQKETHPYRRLARFVFTRPPRGTRHCKINKNVSIWWNIFIREGLAGPSQVQCLNTTRTHNRFTEVLYRLRYRGISKAGICSSRLIWWLCHQFPNKWCKNTIMRRVENFTFYLRERILLPKVKLSVLMLYTDSRS